MSKPTIEEENAYRMQLKQIPDAIIADFVNDHHTIRALIDIEDSMTEEKALTLFDGQAYLLESLIDKYGATLEGTYTADELEAIVWWMRNKASK